MQEHHTAIRRRRAQAKVVANTVDLRPYVALAISTSMLLGVCLLFFRAL